MKSEDAYWDSLGVAWRAIGSDVELVTPRLQARLRRRSFAIAAALSLGIPLCCGATVLGVFTIWRGWTTETWNFVTRGVAIVSVSVLLIRGLASFFPFRAYKDSQTLSDMLEIASAQVRRTLFLIRTAVAASAIAGLLGIAGTAIRIRAGSPPHLSPIIDLAIIVLIVLSLWLYGRAVSVERGKFEYLRRTVGTND